VPARQGTRADCLRYPQCSYSVRPKLIRYPQLHHNTPVWSIVRQMPERKLLDQVSDVARLRHLSLRTEDTYRSWIKRFILFHGKRHPRDLDAEALRRFLTHLAVKEHVAASTQNQAFNSLLFLYRQVLKMEPPNIEGVDRARPSKNLAVVFSNEESNALIAHL